MHFDGGGVFVGSVIAGILRFGIVSGEGAWTWLTKRFGNGGPWS